MQKGKKDLARFAVLHKLGLKGISFRQDILLVFLITINYGFDSFAPLTHFKTV